MSTAITNKNNTAKDASSYNNPKNAKKPDTIITTPTNKG